MRLNNIPFSEFLQLNEVDSYIYSYSFNFGHTLRKPVNRFYFKPITDYTFGQVKDCQQMFESEVKFSDIPKLLAIFHHTEDYYMQVGVVQVLQHFAYVKESIEQIAEVERQTLVRKLSDKEIKAGLERFEQFGVYPQLRAIAQAFNQTIKFARELPYNDGFLELYYQKTLAEYEADYSKVK